MVGEIIANKSPANGTLSIRILAQSGRAAKSISPFLQFSNSSGFKPSTAIKICAIIIKIRPKGVPDIRAIIRLNLVVLAAAAAALADCAATCVALALSWAALAAALAAFRADVPAAVPAPPAAAAAACPAAFTAAFAAAFVAAFAAALAALAACLPAASRAK
jgi:hypothetical protein